jgi:hypothetical protein
MVGPPGTGLDFVAPSEWLNDLTLHITQLGAPAGKYHIRDLLLPGSAAIFANIKVAVFPNAFVLDDQLRLAIQTFAAAQARTLVFYYAPGILNPHDGLINVTRVGEVVGCPLSRGRGNHSLTSTFVDAAAASIAGGEVAVAGAAKRAVVKMAPAEEGKAVTSATATTMPDFSSLAGMRFAPTFEGAAGPPSGR